MHLVRATLIALATPDGLWEVQDGVPLGTVYHVDVATDARKEVMPARRGWSAWKPLSRPIGFPRSIRFRTYQEARLATMVFVPVSTQAASTFAPVGTRSLS